MAASLPIFSGTEVITPVTCANTATPVAIEYRRVRFYGIFKTFYKVVFPYSG